MKQAIADSDYDTRIGTILNGIASGLVPMAVFTPIYALWPVFAWSVPGIIIFILTLIWSAYLAFWAVKLLKIGRSLPRATNEYDARIAKGMAIVSSIQGGLILTSSIILTIFGLWVWILPVVVLVVALHFFPMPAIFGRSIDYYLGGVMLVFALIGLYLTWQSDLSWQSTWAITGTGAAVVTSAYGLWMYVSAKSILRQYSLRTK